MSKKGTLFDFFKKSPSTKSENGVGHSPKSLTPKSVTKNSKLKNSPKEISKRPASPDRLNGSQKEENEEEFLNSTPVTKRRRIVIPSDSDDSADEYKPEKSVNSDDSDEFLSGADSDTETPKPKRKKTTSTPKSLSNFLSPSSTFTDKFKKLKGASSPSQARVTSSKKKPDADVSNDSKLDESQTEDCKTWSHLTYDWLKDPNIRDKKGRLKSHSDYDPRTLLVPGNFMQSVTPAMKQWWDLKSDHFDTILFFKVGKFYELYHMDAVIGVTELGLVYMRGEFAHSGFPEIAYGRYSDRLVEKGYKVARVEQTETPQMLEERWKQKRGPKKDKVISREICQITTKGTRTFTCQDGEPMGASSNFLLAVTEKHSDSLENEMEYGICFIDTSIGKFSLGQFVDDRHSSRLMTLAALYPPAEVLYEKEAVSKKTLQILSNNVSNAKIEALGAAQFWDSSKVLKFLSEGSYFKNKQEDIEWPIALQNMLDKDDQLQRTAQREYELAFKAFGACVWYLKMCCIEENILTMHLFEEYTPFDSLLGSQPVKSFNRKHMVLDGMTLRNLEIVSSTCGSTESTLVNTLDFCLTHFGKRLFRHWLCTPLCNTQSISDRLNAVEDLMNVPDVVKSTMALLKKIPDLERLLGKIHTQGLSHSKEHPDSRAIFYEADIYNKRKINDFLSTLEGFKEAIKITSIFEPHIKEFKSSLLKQCVSSPEEEGLFPDLSELLNYFDQAFDHNQAKKEGNIIPSKGVDKEYDAACAELDEIQDELDSYLKQQQKALHCKASYIGNGRTRFQLEIPDDATRHLPSGFELHSHRKGFKRYYTKDIKDMLARYMSAEETRDSALKDITRRIFQKFDEDYDQWKRVVHCLSVIDVLISFYMYQHTSEVTLCRPEFVLPDENTKPFIDIREGRHPTFLKFATTDTYIPNSLYLGPKKETQEQDVNQGGTLVLVTGPNMGGKSTLMRQTATLAIMAHMGSYVPAEVCRLTPIDRIFTRVGANDRLTAGESTFFVEASETSSILQHASSHSLVLVDELGRGTSTHDGTAIACAVVHHLATQLHCRTLFSTHYHNLVDGFLSYPTVGVGHMACMVEDDNESPTLERITFLYKFIDGICPKSYGFNVASLAGIASEIVHMGFLKAQEMEEKVNISKVIKELLKTRSMESVAIELYEKLAETHLNE